MSRFVLKNLGNDTRPDIIINDTDRKKIVGRNSETQIISPVVSREHLVIKPNFKDKLLLIKFTGKSPSAINGFVIKESEAYEAKENDIINLVISTEYNYKVLFEKAPTELIKPGKRRSEDEMEVSEERVKRQKSSEEDRWDNIDNNKCLVFTSRGVVASEKIAAYDMDKTLIRTMSGNTFPKSIDDWQINFAEVPDKLKKFHENGYKIAVFTNQAGVEHNRVTIPDIKKKITMIQKRLQVPSQFFVSTAATNFRKPRVGMWELLQDRFNDGVKIDMTSSFFVGDAAGRPENKVLKTKKDHSCADRLFAKNLDLNFYTPEEHFKNVKKNNFFTKPEFNPKNFDISMKLLEPDSSVLVSKEQELIIMIGFPASGKSYFCKNYLQTADYEVVNRDTLNSMQKCMSVIEDALKSKKSCVVDNTNPDTASRKKFIDIAKQLKVKVRCFLMTTTYHHSRHNNIFREIIDSSHAKIGDIVFNTYKSKFVPPTLKEGFDEIVKVNCVPKFENAEHEKLYRMYLLEK
ncbi:unnamed protein product [Chironomus riparius]|uniref:PNK FHA domain-containing protein n=1 Tax=Chironomus riparius TaxID=315576 RepID=A0A9N9RR96_9DIPT|nr:unnamed protein product [Chironomus riparius]